MKKYRVEAFIIPVNNKTELEINQIDDVKLANKFKDQSSTLLEGTILPRIVEDDKKSDCDNSLQNETENKESVSEFSEVFFEINEHIYDEIIVSGKKTNIEIKSEKTTTEYAKATLKIEEPIYDEPFVGTLASLNKRNNDNNYDVPQANWILEGNESFDDSTPEFCCHGNKDGCLPSTQRPEDVSEEIFKENWMQRLDALRKLETLLKDKEVALQSRERLLFKKEKELRILERLVKDKMKQAELYAKRCKKTSSSESIAHESKFSNNSREILSNPSYLPTQINSKISLENKDEHIFKNPLSMKSSLISDKLDKENSVRSRYKTQQKKKYDDLDSTLSADIGDSSFVITSKKFDPGALKKPTAFMRSASERRPKSEQNATQPKFINLTEKSERNFLNQIEEKTFKKISENILASQDQTTKFLNYGPIDKSSEVEMKNPDLKELINQKCYSYLNLEPTHKAVKINSISKQRPTSWSENTDDWLMKKRKAYNLATKKMLIENLPEKENFNRQTNTTKSMKVLKKKESSHKKFSIFR
ncbi:reticulocyte-binding protein homolog 2a-like isoform X2 [Phymastichus coffea]|uniref:reticulocyte-binding protein homolog 2a-like isoform X2 n=1 Tax=Phymastichus coffea TaxID=108790 RepID=UPI00273B7B16|nr:reticulocyte-binding protein homolog 2a-like isoform X2 [Phymastichus coffea]